VNDLPVRWRISSGQMLLLIFAMSLCVTPFALPELLISALGARPAWLGTVAALGGALWGTTAAAALARRFHGRPFDQCVIGLLGPYVGRVYLAGLAALFLTGAPAQLVAFTSVVRQELLPFLPGVAPFMAVAVGLYLARSGPEAIGRLAAALAPIVAAGLLVIYVPPVVRSHFGVFLPLRGLAWRQWWSEPVVAAAGTIRGFLCLLVLGPAVARKPSAGRTVAVAVLAWALVAAAVVVPVAIFDAPLVEQMALPFLSSVSTTTWGWLPVRELAPFTVLIWYAITLIVVATYLWMGLWLLERLLPFLPRRGPLWVVAAAMAVAAAAASTELSEPAFRAMFMAWNVAVVGLGVLAPTGLCLLRGAGRTPRAGRPGQGREGGHVSWRAAARRRPVRGRVAG